MGKNVAANAETHHLTDSHWNRLIKIIGAGKCILLLGVPGMPCCEAVEIRCGPDRGNRDSKPTASS
jgi:hypothetical protein